ncbi:hypothetical protein KVR01_006125 [Diaporthe batatas]|uniref:uncharacterized protein n=1 Tax=Diaporthe batatas TaxID=748121 RepID=UPI001D056BB2|nr:uncharacterized protein KVR01_006125 [Diaporthe batatas]KAG8164207.1 hypothetical protein KVR01_006125 [Diaporthe batatas]
MLSHFRIHRRGPSNPSSPLPDQLSPLDHAEHAHPAHDLSGRPDLLSRPTNAASTPPLHPAGPRVDPDPAPDRKTSEQSLKDSSSSPSIKSPQSTADSGFMGGLALENYRRAFASKREDSSAAVRQAPAAQQSQRSKPLPPPINTNLSSARPSPVPVKELRSRSSFVAPTELQNNAGATGKRPSGTRLTSEPAAVASSQSVVESQKGKKGLPFLKNPMSGLLMRRKASQNAPDLRPLPLPQKPAEATYDPRIRGTRVHDFSAPRQRVVPTRKTTVPGAEVWSGPQGSSSTCPVYDHVSRSETGRSSSAVSEKTQPGISDTESQRPHDLSKESSMKSAAELKRVSLDDKPLPAEPEPSAPAVGAQRSASQSSGPSATANTESMAKANPSTRTNKSRHISLSEGSVKDGVALALPKHMKSTSSRFSFDMMGAARAEKALEERHRQKELERKANNPTNRDSRFDDFDEDSFDYDAAMAEDGYEEDIPMVGDDDFLEDDAFFEEDVPVVGDDLIEDAEDDPDNDQENFAGFVFQRSNPQSSLASPATGPLLATPRDATGKAIGYAMTKDTTPEIQSATSPLANSEIPINPEESPNAVDLGTQGSEPPRKTAYDPTVFRERRHQPVDDAGLGVTADKELYFDEGLLEELRLEADEIQASTFDESLFDIDDTDQYGRPIPGAFAQAQAQATRAVQDQEGRKRESDLASASGLSGSTAHTSVSLGLQPMPSMTEKGKELSSHNDAPTVTSPSQNPTEGKVAAYQAALAEAAHKAAASGWKFKWEDQPAAPPSPSPSPPLPQPSPPADSADLDVTITSPTTGSQPNSGGQVIDNSTLGGYDEYADYDDGFGGGFDDNFDDDFFDDDFIAEANAEALAYDSDGFYGQEFGFYSAPVPQGPGGSKAGGSSLTADNVYGGYFGPSGVGRTKSGRVVSREPNLTPITERSEYSNRNSIMSLGLPMGTSEGRNSLQSPGLAQLAMMTDDGKMTLAELLRLRSRAWGGSQVSLSSSREGSPRSERAPPGERFEGTSSPAPWETGRPHSHIGLPGGAHARQNSGFSLWSNSDAASGAGSPTVAMGLSMPNSSVPPQPLFSPPPPPMPQPSSGLQCPPVIEDEEEVSSPSLSAKSPTVDLAREGEDAYGANATLESVVNPPDAATAPPPAPLGSPPAPPPSTTISPPSKRPGHRHKNSAESISYSIDEDKESGETRWVMERRRTAESGEIEVLRREVVSAGSI